MRTIYYISRRRRERKREREREVGERKRERKKIVKAGPRQNILHAVTAATTTALDWSFKFAERRALLCC